ncbi:dynein intermediate chain 3, ciliary-like [Musca vetustissima]|uniref:dynein intermediate chain 3, ciliary-like n=1 Tax=Musca vetustissima TaxID=27455 RepID=UPI002AB7C4CA|nr:dynein intermediate chain 3, ciliary-like [Musca vetustissima]
MYSANQFVYTRERRRFGRQCLFSDRNQLMLSINPSKRQRCQFVLRNPVHQATQLGRQLAYTIMETENVTLAEHGMYHYEGGWPKEVNIKDEESTLRHRKKIERDDNWGGQVIGLIHHAVDVAEENTTMNIYQDFFVDLTTESGGGGGEDIKSAFESRQKNIFHDPEIIRRPVSVLDWTPNDVRRYLVLHTNIPLERPLPGEEANKKELVRKEEKKKITLLTPLVKQEPVLNTNDFYIWNLENPLKPMITFNSDDKVLKSLYCPKDENWIAGGLQSGKICLWNSKMGGQPVSLCPLEAAHREPVATLCWVHSKTNTEFYTGSYDGSVKYWDGRNLDNPLQELLMDPEMTDDQVRSRSHGVTVMEFEYTIPIRFIVASDMGSIFIGNRKGMTPMETLAAGNYRLFHGPIRSVERNPFFVKNFLITGDWCAKIWAEECKGSPLTFLVKKRHQILCGSWSTARCSLFVTGDIEGELDFWDMLLSQRLPIFSVKFSSRVLSVRFRSDGEFLAVGLGNGDIQILEMDKAMKHSTSKDKALMVAMFEREQLRCKLLEGRVEEIKLRHRLTAADLERKTLLEMQQQTTMEPLDPDNPDEFLRLITSDEEFRNVLNSFQDYVLKVDRKRQLRECIMEVTDFEVEYTVPSIEKISNTPRPSDIDEDVS